MDDVSLTDRMMDMFLGNLEDKEPEEQEEPKWVAFFCKKLGEFDRFKDAAKAALQAVFDVLQEGGMSWQVLETAVWVETPSKTPILFYDLRDIAIEAGWLENGTGKWADDDREDCG